MHGFGHERDLMVYLHLRPPAGNRDHVVWERVDFNITFRYAWNKPCPPQIGSTINFDLAPDAPELLTRAVAVCHVEGIEEVHLLALPDDHHEPPLPTADVIAKALSQVEGVNDVHHDIPRPKK